MLLALAVAALGGQVAFAKSFGRDGGTIFHDHVFPVDGPHGTRGPIGEFGAPRSGGRWHEGFDVAAACGTPLVAVRNGRVLRTGFDPVLYGNFVLIHGEGEDRSYFYAHMPRPALVHRGEHVFTGERVGSVGETGNAISVGCHLHFEIHVHGHPIDPEPSLRRWDAYSRSGNLLSAIVKRRRRPLALDSAAGDDWTIHLSGLSSSSYSRSTRRGRCAGPARLAARPTRAHAIAPTQGRGHEKGGRRGRSKRPHRQGRLDPPFKLWSASR